MNAIYHTTTNELTVDFFKFLKKQFKNYNVDIVIREKDKTDYLNSSKINKRYLEEAIQEVKRLNFGSNR
jgi:hypothetical protein